MTFLSAIWLTLVVRMFLSIDTTFAVLQGCISWSLASCGLLVDRQCPWVEDKQIHFDISRYHQEVSKPLPCCPCFRHHHWCLYFQLNVSGTEIVCLAGILAAVMVLLLRYNCLRANLEVRSVAWHVGTAIGGLRCGAKSFSPITVAVTHRGRHDALSVSLLPPSTPDGAWGIVTDVYIYIVCCRYTAYFYMCQHSSCESLLGLCAVIASFQSRFDYFSAEEETTF